MRKHVGFHILKYDLGLVWGFCGLAGCSIDLMRGYGRGKTTILIPASNCKYICKFSLKSAVKSTKTDHAQTELSSAPSATLCNGAITCQNIMG